MGLRLRTFLTMAILTPVATVIWVQRPFAETPVTRSISGSIVRETHPSETVYQIYREERQFLTKGELVLKTRIEDLKGALQVESETHIQDLIPVSHTERHPQSQIEESASLENRILKLTRKTPRGEFTHIEKVAPNEVVIFGPTVEAVIRKHWKELQFRKELPVRVASARRLDSYRFDIRFLGTTDAHSRCLFQLRGRGLLVRAFSKPVDFVFDCQAQELLTVIGPSPLFDPDDHFATFRAITRFDQAGGRMPASPASQD